jgi:hypothetical protein
MRSNVQQAQFMHELRMSLYCPICCPFNQNLSPLILQSILQEAIIQQAQFMHELRPYVTILSNLLTVQSISFASNSPRQLHVLGHDGLSLCMQGVEVGVFKQVDRVVLEDLLKQENGFLRPAACTEGSMTLQYCLTNTSCARSTFVDSQCV